MHPQKFNTKKIFANGLLLHDINNTHEYLQMYEYWVPKQCFQAGMKENIGWVLGDMF